MLDDNDQDIERDQPRSGGQMLLIFFGLVVFGALFFGFGYAVGHSAVKIQTPVNGGASAALQPAGTANKPGADQPGSSLPPCQPAVVAPEQQPSPQPQVVTPAAEPAKSEAKDVAKGKDKSASKNAAPAHATAPVGSGVMLQIAAVSRREDAERLRAALEQKQYPVYVSAGAGDSLYHVQVGPYATKDDADKIKKKLSDLGYSPIVKH